MSENCQAKWVATEEQIIGQTSVCISETGLVLWYRITGRIRIYAVKLSNVLLRGHRCCLKANEDAWLGVGTLRPVAFQTPPSI